MIEINKIYDKLIVLKNLEERWYRPDGKGSEPYYLCEDIETGRKGKVIKSQIGKNTKTGRNFPIEPFNNYGVIDWRDYMRQYYWNYTTKKKYRQTSISINNPDFGNGIKPYKMLEHDMVWKLLLGEKIPGYSIDHINGKTTCNHPKNLRLVTPAQNNWNKGPRGNKKYKGVYGYKKSYISKLVLNNSKTYTKIFKTELEAAHQYDTWVKTLLPEDIRLEHDLPGNVAGRFIPYLNFPNE